MGKHPYPFLGPREVAEAVAGRSGTAIRTPDAFEAWVAGTIARDVAGPLTFVVGLDGVLYLSPRHTEHVLCAGGASVLAAGEISFGVQDGRWAAVAVSNQATGYCPDPDSWPAVESALARAGLGHPGEYTHPVIFRRCAECGDLTAMVGEGCAACATRHWAYVPELVG